MPYFTSSFTWCPVPEILTCFAAGQVAVCGICGHDVSETGFKISILRTAEVGRKSMGSQEDKAVLERAWSLHTGEHLPEERIYLSMNKDLRLK
jgi:hypothetical protein